MPFPQLCDKGVIQIGLPHHNTGTTFNCLDFELRVHDDTCGFRERQVRLIARMTEKAQVLVCRRNQGCQSMDWLVRVTVQRTAQSIYDGSKPQGHI